MKKNILIAGGAGFLGSHLCDRILKDGDEIFCMDNLSTGSKKNISHLENNPNFHFIEHDIINTIDNKELFNKNFEKNMDIFKQLGIERYCCKRHLLTHVNLIENI